MLGRWYYPPFRFCCVSRSRWKFKESIVFRTDVQTLVKSLFLWILALAVLLLWSSRILSDASHVCCSLDLPHRTTRSWNKREDHHHVSRASPLQESLSGRPSLSPYYCAPSVPLFQHEAMCKWRTTPTSGALSMRLQSAYSCKKSSGQSSMQVCLTGMQRHRPSLQNWPNYSADYQTVVPTLHATPRRAHYCHV
jgi:hypothetical protein